MNEKAKKVLNDKLKELHKLTQKAWEQKEAYEHALKEPSYEHNDYYGNVAGRFLNGMRAAYHHTRWHHAHKSLSRRVRRLERLVKPKKKKMSLPPSKIKAKPSAYPSYSVTLAADTSSTTWSNSYISTSTGNG